MLPAGPLFPRLFCATFTAAPTAEPEAAAPPPPAFVAMTLDLPAAGSGCILALSDARGRALRIEWPRPLASEVAAVARSLWEAAP
jgi:hypothetical protein